MSKIVSIRLSDERYVRLQKEANHDGKPLGTYLKDLIENWEGICMKYYWDGLKEYKNGMIFEDDLFKGFLKKVEQADYDDEQKEHMRAIAIRAMMDARQ